MFSLSVVAYTTCIQSTNTHVAPYTSVFIRYRMIIVATLKKWFSLELCLRPIQSSCCPYAHKAECVSN